MIINAQSHTFNYFKGKYLPHFVDILRLIFHIARRLRVRARSLPTAVGLVNEKN